MRNRLIAGLARATLIVEAGLPSGTFSTADEALAANREVLVVPGSILSETSRGSNRLLLEGATPVVDEESFSGQLAALFPLSACVGGQLTMPGCGSGAVPGAPSGPVGAGDHGADPRLSGLEPDSRKLAAMLFANPMRLEQIASEFACEERGEGLGLGGIVALVAKLEGAGLVVRYPDGRFGPAE